MSQDGGSRWSVRSDSDGRSHYAERQPNTDMFPVTPDHLGPFTLAEARAVVQALNGSAPAADQERASNHARVLAEHMEAGA